MIVLGIETSCDETAAAVVVDGRKVLSSVVASQIAVHQPYGGVVPELASRKHMEAIVPVVRRALSDCGMDFSDIDGVAATQGPGLIGALLVGFSFAKALAFARGIPFIGINHLEGHIHSVFLESDPPPFPFAALLVSGGHTGIYHVQSHTGYRLMGQTRDDAVGEAYDKVAKMLGLGYPGGTIIDRLAARGRAGQINFSRPFLDKDGYDFSFSGIKTAVGRFLAQHGPVDSVVQQDIAAGFQAAAIEVLTYKIIHAAVFLGTDHLAIVGGVAANSELRKMVAEKAGEKGLKVHIPDPALCGDNAAMIAAVGYHYLTRGKRAGLNEDVYSRIPPAKNST
jgi:N6-L-threonylcarbamoyladenine synthase